MKPDSRCKPAFSQAAWVVQSLGTGIEHVGLISSCEGLGKFHGLRCRSADPRVGSREVTGPQPGRWLGDASWPCSWALSSTARVTGPAPHHTGSQLSWSVQENSKGSRPQSSSQPQGHKEALLEL